jgi:rhodanese-related sulfurtransferase
LSELHDETVPEGALGNLGGEEVQAMAAEGVPVVDIRRPEEWALTGVIAGSHLITFFDERNEYDIDTWLAALAQVTTRDEPFILVCRMGVRTEVVGRYLAGTLKFSGVYHLQHGINSWIGHGHPVTAVPS